jgi:O-antigen/teichoic acid export membrane protein
LTIAGSQTVRVRVGATFVGNVTRSGLAFLSGILVARGLGASAFGDFSFLLGTFAALGPLLELGTASAFYTFLAQRRRSRAFLRTYLAWMGLQFLVPLAVLAILPNRALAWIWLDHSRQLVAIAFVASFLLNQAWTMMTHLAEARRQTVLVQVVTIVQASVHLGLVAAALVWHVLSVELVLVLSIAEYIACLAYLAPRLIAANIDTDAAPDRRGQIVGQFTRYCGPLVVFSWVSFAHVFADRWLLQRYGGSLQQGLFALASQFAMIGTLVTASMVKVLWKELAEAREHGNAGRVAELYGTTARGLHLVAAWIACLLVPYAREIIAWTVGREFSGATFCLMVMLLYPVQQAIGQVQATLFYASEDTKSYSRIGLWTMALSIPVTYLLIAPSTAWVPGLALGAVGVALKTVVVGFVVVEVQGVVLGRRHGWNSGIVYRAGALAVLLLVGLAARGVAQAFVSIVVAPPPPVLVVATGALVYLLATMAIAWRYPAFTGLDRLMTRLAPSAWPR